MSTITFRDGIMAADSRGYSGNKVPIGFKRKIKKLPDGTLIGVSTTIPGGGEALIKWFEDTNGDREVKPDAGIPESFTLLVVRPNGEVFFASDNSYLSGPLEAPFYAIGSGEMYALGAMSMGATAETAVAVAAEHDVWTDGEIYTERLS